MVGRRRGEGAPDLLRVELGSGGQALPVFLSAWSAHNFVFSNRLEREWRVEERPPGELASAFAGSLAHVDWVLLDPPARLRTKDASARLTPRGDFLEYLGACRAPSSLDPCPSCAQPGLGGSVEGGAGPPGPPAEEKDDTTLVTDGTG